MAEAGSALLIRRSAHRNLTSRDHGCCVRIIAVSQGYSPGGVWTVVGRWHFLVVVVVSVFAFATTAQAAPVFLSAIDISDAGQDGFRPQVEIDSSGNVHAVWTRSDGTDLPDSVLHAYAVRRLERTGEHLRPGAGRLEAADSRSTRRTTYSRCGAAPTARTCASRRPSSPSAGSFGAPVTVSDPGFDAFEPQLDFDDTGKAIAVWSRFDGTNIRVQATTRTAGAGGAFANEVTLSAPGQDANDPVTAAGPNVDANGVVSWYRSRRHEPAGPVLPPPGRGRVPEAGGSRSDAGFAGAGVQRVRLAEPHSRTEPGVPVLQPAGAVFRRVDRRHARCQRLPGELRRRRCRFKVTTGNAATEANEADVTGGHQGRRRAQTRPESERTRLHRPGRDQRQPPDHGPAQCCRAAGARHRPDLPARLVGSVRGDGRDDQGRRLHHDHQSERDPSRRGAGRASARSGNWAR